MFRYKKLILQALDPDAKNPTTLRKLARAIGVTPASVHNYVHFDTLPRIENVSKMADYFGVTISSLFSEDDDLTTELVEAVRKLPKTRKKQLLKDLK